MPPQGLDSIITPIQAGAAAGERRERPHATRVSRQKFPTTLKIMQPRDKLAPMPPQGLDSIITHIQAGAAPGESRERPPKILFTPKISNDPKNYATAR